MQLGNNEFNERSDIDLFHSGEHYHAYNYMGAHKEHRDGVDGVMFRTWAPHAKSVSIVGTFNNWDRNAHPMNWTSDGGIMLYCRYSRRLFHIQVQHRNL